MTSLRILLVEDSVLLREGLVRLFAEAGHETVAALPDAAQVLEAIAEHRPDVVVLDVRLPPTFRDEGIQAALRIRAGGPEPAILVLSQYVEGAYARELLAGGEGAMGYLLKDRVTSLVEVDEALQRVAAGGTVLDPQVVRDLLAHDPLQHLTPREREVLELMAQGHSNSTVAARLVVGLGAVEKHISSIFTKLGLQETGSDHRRVLAVLAWVQRRR